LIPHFLPILGKIWARISGALFGCDEDYRFEEEALKSMVS